MLGLRWHLRPFDSGAHLTGGRWNPPGQWALYLSSDYNTAIAEMHQDLVRPRTLVAFDVAATAIADLTSIDSATALCSWRSIHRIDRREPPTWAVARDVLANGAQGALVPSALVTGGVNLVLWHWRDATVAGDGATLSLLDPERVLTGRAGR